jgi:hypothetical protein
MMVLFGFEKHFDAGNAYIGTFADKDLVQPRIMTNLCVQSSAFVALRSINLGYRLPAKYSNKVGIAMARLYVSGQNLIYLLADDYTSFNPEGITNSSSPLRGGYQIGAAPIPMAVTVGMKVEF